MELSQLGKKNPSHILFTIHDSSLQQSNHPSILLKNNILKLSSWVSSALLLRRERAWASTARNKSVIREPREAQHGFLDSKDEVCSAHPKSLFFSTARIRGISPKEGLSILSSPPATAPCFSTPTKVLSGFVLFGKQVT